MMSRSVEDLHERYVALTDEQRFMLWVDAEARARSAKECLERANAIAAEVITNLQHLPSDWEPDRYVTLALTATNRLKEITMLASAVGITTEEITS